MPYPSQPQPRPLPEFAGAAYRHLSGDQRRRLEAFIVDGYTKQGLSLRQLSQLTDRSFSEVRNVLAAHGVQRRPSGAPRARPTAGGEPTSGGHAPSTTSAPVTTPSSGRVRRGGDPTRFAAARNRRSGGPGRRPPPPTRDA